MFAHATTTIRKQHHYQLKLINFVTAHTDWQQSQLRSKLTPTNTQKEIYRSLSASSSIPSSSSSLSSSSSSLLSSPSSSSSSSSSSRLPVRYPHDLFAFVDRGFGDLITEYPDMNTYRIDLIAASEWHCLAWYRVPEEGEAEREALREADRRALAEGKWKRPYAHLIEAGRDMNSATGKKVLDWSEKIVCNFDSPSSHVKCYRIVLTSDARDPRLWSNDWRIQSVIGYREIPTQEMIDVEKNGYIKALG